MNKYTSIEANQKFEETSPEKVLKEAFSEFQRRYFMDKGYAEDMHGVSLTFLQMFYQVVTQLKIWQQQGFSQVESSIDKTLENVVKELRYWHITYKISTTKNPIKKLYLKIKRKLLI